MNKLMLVAAGLVAASITSQAAITSVIVTDTATDLKVTGTWTPLTLASWTVPGLANWSVALNADAVGIGGGVILNMFQADGTYLPVLSAPGSAALGLLDVAGNAGGPIMSAAIPGVHWYSLTGSIGPAGTFNYVFESHIPEPSTYAMIAGLGLVGFAGYRRMRG